jgi:hypothetical protein
MPYSFSSALGNDSLTRVRPRAGGWNPSQAVEEDGDGGHLAMRLRSNRDVEGGHPIQFGWNFRAADDQKDGSEALQAREDARHRFAIHREMNRDALELAKNSAPIVCSADLESAPPPGGDRIQPRGESGIGGVEEEFAGSEGTGDQRDMGREAGVAPGAVTDPEDRDNGTEPSATSSPGA